MKKIIIILTIILAVAAVGAGVYFGWKNAKTVLTPPTNSTSEQNVGAVTIPQNNQAISTTLTDSTLKLSSISDQPVFDYFVRRSIGEGGSSLTEVFYITGDGKIFKAKDGGEDEGVSSEAISNLQKIYSSFDGKRVLIRYGDLNSPQFKLFNSETKIFEMLPENIAAANFSPDAKKITYFEKTSGNLMTKDLGISKPQTVKIMTISQNDFDLEWILPEKIILTTKPSSFYSGSAWAVDVKNKTIAPLASELNGLMFKWSGDGKIGLEFFSQSQGRVGKLNLIDTKGAISANLGFMTLPDKCLILQPKIYCAIPREIPVRTTLPDDYLKRAVYFEDIFYQIDIAQNSFTEILAGGNSAIDAVNLKIVDNKLIFINRYDNKVYSLSL